MGWGNIFEDFKGLLNYNDVSITWRVYIKNISPPYTWQCDRDDYIVIIIAAGYSKA